VAYGGWLVDTLRLDLGTSFRYNEPVLEVIADRLPVSIYYGIITAIFTYGICIPLGILKAIRHRTRVDTWTSVLIFVGYAVPGFALGAVLSNLLAVRWEVFPLGGFMSAGADALPWHERWLDIVWHSVLPLVAYLAGAFAVTTMLMKNSLLENMSADYVKTALAKGLSWKRAVFVHALRNSLIPMATTVGGLLGIFLTGSFLIERVFNIPGIGPARVRGDSDARLPDRAGFPRHLQRVADAGQPAVGPGGGLRRPARAIRVRRRRAWPGPWTPSRASACSASARSGAAGGRS
jgi:microcin C transport system permease protein